MTKVARILTVAAAILAASWDMSSGQEVEIERPAPPRPR